MPLKFNVKKHEPRFKGDRPSWNATVSGPYELFSDKLDKTLFQHGLNSLPGESNIVVWSTRPANSPPPLYLGAILRKKFHATLSPMAGEMLRIAESPYRGEGMVADEFGANGAGDAGRRALRVVSGQSVFLAPCDKDHAERRVLLAGAGWLPIAKPNRKLMERFGTHPFMTRDPFIAANMLNYMDPKGVALVSSMLKKAQAYIEASKSQAVPANFDIPVPEGLDYMDFQKGGIGQILETGKSGIIADDMGLGKTIQGIGIVNGRPQAERVLVFCQANMRLKWPREIEKWKVNEALSVGYAEGDFFPETDVVVINYDIVARHVEKIRAVQWDIVLADEAHNLKNEDTQRTGAVLGDLESEFPLDMVPLSEGGLLVHLTGTPKPNRVSEMWLLLSSSRPDIWGRGAAAKKAFLERYEPPRLIRREVTIGGQVKTKIVSIPGDATRELELQRRLRGSGSFVRRLKRDTDLPPKFRTPIEMPLNLTESEQRILRQAEAHLDQIHARIAGELNIRVGESRIAGAIIDVIDGLPAKSPHFSEIARVRRNLGVLKAPYVAGFVVSELLADEELAPELRRKTVLFAHHKEVIREIAGIAEEFFPGGVLVYDGSVSNKKKQQRVDEFQNNPAARLFIMSLSGATGITLTASNRMRLGEFDFSPSNMAQIEDRIWRIGQEQPCDIGYLLVPNSMDVNTGLALIRKMEVDERAINGLSYRGMRSSSAARATATLTRSDQDNETALLEVEERATQQLSV